MKSIIVISTLLFVIASFMGIANYVQHNQSLSEKGLYASPQAPTYTSAEEETEQSLHTVAEQLQEPNTKVKEEVVVPLPKKSAKSKAKKKEPQEVYHAAKKPREREINFKEFSRAPLDDYEALPAQATEVEVAESTKPTKVEEVK